MNQRELALSILYKTIRDESYSNLLMRKELNKVEPIRRAFITNLVNGVLRYYEYLIYQVDAECKKITPLRIKLILAMAFYERFFLNEKDYVVNYEYVELASNSYDKSFINAILRKKDVLLPCDIPHVKACLPEWIYNLLKSQYSADEFNKITEVYHQIPSVYYRLNKKKCSFEDLKNLKINELNDDIFTCKDNLLDSKQAAEGCFYVQDYNSASLYKHLDLQKGNTLLDVCSAPGSKLFNCLDILDPKDCYANDVNLTRVKLISKMADKLGFKGVNYLNCDGRLLTQKLKMKFDRILLDAPCSGLGVLGRKPDLKLHIKPTSLDELQKLQMELLKSVEPLLEDNGILLYATCTLNKKENGKQIRKYLADNSTLMLLEEDTIINEMGDCFYYAKMQKVR